MTWSIRGRTLPLDRPFVLGVVNVTPDSFSDGGLFFGTMAAADHGERLLDEGADGVDVGGESTRPRNTGPVPAEDEVARVAPVVRELRRRRPDAVISVDTTKAAVARAALAEGADVINDVSGLRLDPALGAACAEGGAGVILMHSRGLVQDMATFAHATYGDDPAAEVAAELGAALARADAAGIARGRIVLDPGIGFAKRVEHSVAVLRGLPRLAALGRPLLVGASRKRVVGALSGVEEPAARVHGSVGAHVASLALGASLFRAHDVRAHREALDVAWALLRG
ncbi:dihydropteroate synthase [Roseisolibacter sp. H3M3-2]|uniref:dihydropteroate synthase n=1 Tax=Roseisolibacter sp. H3M3-2 TaxID=3031323 RepID=UPI0023DAF112|nr:dihydropteroate synthase [Roseisolibacter sp. H3M3-2]MDF1505591.1 dihydropteroate synthase [Roseisolibacter sp. H3M3-2]